MHQPVHEFTDFSQNLQTVSTSTRDTHSHAMGLTTLLKRSLPQPPAASLTTTTTAATSGRK